MYRYRGRGPNSCELFTVQPVTPKIPLFCTTNSRVRNCENVNLGIHTWENIKCENVESRRR